MKRTQYILLLIVILFAACKKKKSTIVDPRPDQYTYTEALRAVGLEPDNIYEYNEINSSPWRTDLAIRFHPNGRGITEYITSEKDSLTYDVETRVIQPTIVGELPKIVFTPYNKEEHILLTNEQKWQSLNFLRYSADSAVLQKGTVVYFECLGKVKYDGPQELRRK